MHKNKAFAAVMVIMLLSPIKGIAENRASVKAFTISGGTLPSGARRIPTWFARFDTIRRKSQMPPSEKEQADKLLVKGMFASDDQKAAAKELLYRLIGKYNQAIAEMKTLPHIPETQRLQAGYYQYFLNARDLFTDYLKVQDHMLAKDADGHSIFAGLLDRKRQLEDLRNLNEDLDNQTRQHYHIPSYHYY